MDKKDEAIVKVLARKAGLSSRALSKIVALPISTVHRRVKRLEQEGVIIGYKALINHEKTTTPIGALLLINLAEVIPGKGHIPRKKIIAALRKFKEIEEIVEVQATHFDFIIKARFLNLKKLSAFTEELRSVEGIEEISLAIITEEMILPPQISFEN